MSDDTNSGNNRPQWQQLWFTLQARPWSSLAIIDTAAGRDAETVARALSAVAHEDAGLTVDVVGAQGAGFNDLPRLIADVTEASPQHLRLVACDAPGRNPAMIPILQSVSGAVVVVRLGVTTADALDTAIDIVGREKVIASVSVG